MRYVKLDEIHQKISDAFHEVEDNVIELVNTFDFGGKTRWSSIARTQLEQGFMALQRAITLKNIESNKENSKKEE